MSFSFKMVYHPTYQRRYGKCAICRQGIVAGDKIMLGTGYFHGRVIKNHNHYDCWLKEIATRAERWFFANGYEPTAMSPEKKAKLNRLRAKRYYIQEKGGEPNEVQMKLERVAQQIALVKAE